MLIFDLWTLVLGSKKYYLQEPQNHFPIREHSPKIGEVSQYHRVERSILMFRV